MYYESNNSLAHYGVKGMKWGVRKKRKNGNKYAPSPRVILKGKTKNGETVIAKQCDQSKIATFLARHNVKTREGYEKSKIMDVRNGDGKNIGNLQLYHESPTSLNVQWISIDNKYRGRGYAQTVMSMAENYARKSGAKQMTLEVPSNSPDARHIYEKQGFEVVGRISSDDVWGGLTAMKKKLK